MGVAYELAREALPSYSHKFSRHDFTLPQLFACLVVKEHQRKSYREIEALLLDAPQWCREIGMSKVPDHNTLCRAFHALRLGRRAAKLLDVLAEWFAVARVLGDTVAVDSTLFDTRHRSRHYEQRLPEALRLAETRVSLKPVRSSTAPVAPRKAVWRIRLCSGR